ncbi:MAG TPA: hypothetical protein VFC63_06225 [Blastocatellia bacterium]|nr:hypothetical protein [Blastocatellia bacterium]
MPDDNKPLFPRQPEDDSESQRELIENTRRRIQGAERTTNPLPPPDPATLPRPPAPIYGPPPFPANRTPPVVMYGPPPLPVVKPRNYVPLIVIGAVLLFAIILFIGIAFFIIFR